MKLEGNPPELRIKVRSSLAVLLAVEINSFTNLVSYVFVERTTSYFSNILSTP